MNKPKICPTTRWYLDVYFRLTGSRYPSFGGMTNIPLSEITNYANEFEIITTKEDFCTIMILIDDAYVSYNNDKLAEETERKENSNK